MNRIELGVGDSGDKSLVILQSLLCLLREKNLLEDLWQSGRAPWKMW